MKYLLVYNKIYESQESSCTRTYKLVSKTNYASGIRFVFERNNIRKSGRTSTDDHIVFIKSGKIYCESELGIVTEGEILPEGLTQILPAAVSSDTETLAEAKMRIAKEALETLNVT